MDWRPLTYLAFLPAALALPACRQQMAQQPRYRPLQQSSFFKDERSARPLVAGTVPRGQLPTDTEEFTGRRTMKPKDWAEMASLIAASPGAPLPALVGRWNWSPYADEFPFRLVKADFDRGQERFNIYCAVCHDRAGTGHGMVVRRGFTAPPSYHGDFSRGFKLRGMAVRLPDAPVGYYFEVITRGFGAMPDYAGQVPVADRWRIIAYIRALQLSQHANLADIADAGARSRLLKGGGAP